MVVGCLSLLYVRYLCGICFFAFVPVSVVYLS